MLQDTHLQGLRDTGLQVEGSHKPSTPAQSAGPIITPPRRPESLVRTQNVIQSAETHMRDSEALADQQVHQALHQSQ